MEFLETKTELFCFLYLTEDTQAVVNLIEDDVWEDKYEQTVALNE